MSTMLLIHICAATIAMLAGAFAVFFRKGSSWHAAAGTVFFVSMLAMTSSGFYVAAFVKLNRLNVMMSILTFYLVATAWMAAKRRVAKVGIVDWLALLIVLGDAIRGITWGIGVAGRGSSTAVVYFVFGSIALLCAVGDVRMIARGGYTGPKRIARHLWRMCFAFWIALMSFYPGQAKLFPESWRKTNLLMMPALVLIVYMFVSLFRTVRSRRKPVVEPVAA